ncbi:MAG: hypothetical protein ACE5HO_17655 [bacterium]
MKTQSVDTQPQAEKLQISLIRQASLAKRISLVRSLSNTTLQLSRRALAAANPDLNQKELQILFVELNYGVELANRFRKRIREKPPMITQEILEAMRTMVEVLEQLGIDYYFGGSIASSALGIPRSTLDLDVVADLHPKDAKAFVQLLKSEYYVDEEMLLQAIEQRSTFNLVHLETLFKVDLFVLKNRAFDRQAFTRRVKETLDEQETRRQYYLCTAEDIILNKLERYRQEGEVSERQWLDVLGVMKVQQSRLDRDYLARWAANLRVGDLLSQALQEAGLS